MHISAGEAVLHVLLCLSMCVLPNAILQVPTLRDLRLVTKLARHSGAAVVEVAGKRWQQRNARIPACNPDAVTKCAGMRRAKTELQSHPHIPLRYEEDSFFTFSALLLIHLSGTPIPNILTLQQFCGNGMVETSSRPDLQSRCPSTMCSGLLTKVLQGNGCQGQQWDLPKLQASSLLKARFLVRLLLLSLQGKPLHVADCYRLFRLYSVRS